MDFPIVDLMDQEGCRRKLFDLLYPEGFACPRCDARDGLGIHRRRPDSPVVDYRCKDCRRVFNMFTDTPWQGTHLSPTQIVLIPRGVAQGVPTAKLAREVGISRQHLLRLRHEIQARTLAAADREPLPDDQTEADEMYQNAGERRGPAHRPGRPAKAARQPGQGARDLGDRPPVPGVTGRRSGRLWLRVGHRSGSAELVDATVVPATEPGAMVYTDDWNGYKPLGRAGRGHATVNHGQGEFARDDDGDGIREVHCNTMEGIWTGLRNFLRPFRGVNKVCSRSQGGIVGITQFRFRP